MAACVNVIPEVRSIFFWEKKISKEKEVLLIAKTRRELFESVAKEVKKLHSYDLPEIIALPIEVGSDEYLNWIEDTMTTEDNPYIRLFLFSKDRDHESHE